MCISLLTYKSKHIYTDCFEVSEFNSDICAVSSATTAKIKRDAGKYQYQYLIQK